MLWSRIWLGRLSREVHSTKKLRTGRTNDWKNSVDMPIVTDCTDEGFSSKRKIRQLSIDSEQEKYRKRRRIGEPKGAHDTNVDRISELPEPIIHRILDRIKCSKDIGRTSILSKKWKDIFNSYLTYDFDERWFCVPKAVGKHKRIKARELQKKKFMAYVNHSIATRLDPVPCIDKFRLYVNNMDNRVRDCMEQWICAAMKKNVKELDIQLNTTEKAFLLPDVVLLSTSIASLKLSGYIFFKYTLIAMSNLRELSVKGTLLICEVLIKNIDKGCPLLEDLRLVHCRGILRISIPSLVKLKRVEVHECDKVVSIDIASPNLESFSFLTGKNQECIINLESPGSLKKLTLKDDRMTDSGLQVFLSQVPLLENLTLIKCAKLRRLTLLSDRIKSLTLLHCYKLQEVDIDAPKLSSLQYRSHWVPLLSCNIPGLREAKFSFGHTMRRNKLLFKHQRQFLNLDRSKGFKLIVYSKQDLKIYGDPKETLEDQDLFSNLVLTASLTSVMKIVDDWLRESHGRCIVLVSTGSELIQLTHRMIMDREENPSCCRFYSNKCWRHYIEDVTTRNLASIDKICYDFKWICGHRSQ